MSPQYQTLERKYSQLVFTLDPIDHFHLALEEMNTYHLNKDITDSEWTRLYNIIQGWLNIKEN